jgi:hypothetical protein
MTELENEVSEAAEHAKSAAKGSASNVGHAASEAVH